ncbi:hypothetical protein BC826DRAFT_998847, partial [Russula brevipes]
IKIKYLQEGIIRELVDCRLASRSIELSLEVCQTFLHLRAFGGTIGRGDVGKCTSGDDIGRDWTLVGFSDTAM